MKRIAIFIDGTWNRPDAEDPTNVIRLARCINHVDPLDNVQHVIYSPGVGSGRGNNRIARRLDRVLGGALGWGLTDIIEETYRNLVFCYEPGDEIHVFGFSRGAFAARSLVGLIRACGIAPRRHLKRIPEAMARYASRKPSTQPEDPESYAFRADFAPDTATSRAEYKSRRARGDQSILLQIPYVGVWDTVSALGLPAFVPFAAAFNAQYQFHDDKLSRMVLAARHAVAVDERRKTFPVLLWDNLATLNASHEATVPGAAGGPVPAPGMGVMPPYQQLWFPGDHGSVGGGGVRVGLSSVALYWVALGAARAGLSISWEEFDRIAPQYNPVGGGLVNKFGPVGLSGLLMNAFTGDRDGPTDRLDLSLAAADRIWADDRYRPQTLAAVARPLAHIAAQDRAALRNVLIARDGGRTHEPGSQIRPRDWG